MSFKGSQDPKKHEGKRVFQFFSMSIEALDWCRKKVGRLTDEGFLGGWRAKVDGENGGRPTWFRGPRRVRGVPKRGDGSVWQRWPVPGSSRCKQIPTTSRQGPTGTAGVKKGPKTPLSLRPEGGMEGQKTEAPQPSGRRASCRSPQGCRPRGGERAGPDQGGGGAVTVHPLHRGQTGRPTGRCAGSADRQARLRPDPCRNRCR